MLPLQPTRDERTGLPEYAFVNRRLGAVRSNLESLLSLAADYPQGRTTKAPFAIIHLWPHPQVPVPSIPESTQSTSKAPTRLAVKVTDRIEASFWLTASASVAGPPFLKGWPLRTAATFVVTYTGWAAIPMMCSTLPRARSSWTFAGTLGSPGESPPTASFRLRLLYSRKPSRGSAWAGTMTRVTG